MTKNATTSVGFPYLAIALFVEATRFLSLLASKGVAIIAHTFPVAPTYLAVSGLAPVYGIKGTPNTSMPGGPTTPAWAARVLIGTQLVNGGFYGHLKGHAISFL